MRAINNTFTKKNHLKNALPVVCGILVIGVIAFLLFFDTSPFWKEKVLVEENAENTVIPVGGIGSLTATIVELSPKENSLKIEMTVPVRHEEGIPIEETYVRPVILTDATSILNAEKN